MVLAASTIECIGFGIYSAIFLRCGLQNIARPNAEAVARLMRAGPILGVSLGVAIFALIASVWLTHGRFALADFPAWGQLTLMILFAMWVSNLIRDGMPTLHGRPRRLHRWVASPSSAPLLLHCVLVVGLWIPGCLRSLERNCFQIFGPTKKVMLPRLAPQIPTPPDRRRQG